MSAVFTKWFPSGFRLINGLTLSNWFNNPQPSWEDNITAHAGGGQPNAYQLNAAVSRITVSGTANDSVKLLPSTNFGGSNQVVINDGVSNVEVYPGNATDSIDGAGANTGVVITAGKRTIFFVTAAGNISSLEGSKTT